MRGAVRAARIVAATVEVECPYCGEPQPSPDNGSHLWVPSQIAAAQGKKTCVACDEEFQLNAQSRVPVQS